MGKQGIRAVACLTSLVLALAGRGAKAPDPFAYPSMTNVMSFLVQVTNSTSFALLSTNNFARFDVPLYTNREDIAAVAATTNVAALLEQEAAFADVPAKAPAAGGAASAAAPKPLNPGLGSASAPAAADSVANLSAAAVTNLVRTALTNQVKQAAMDAVVEAVNAVNAAADKVAESEARRRIASRTFKLNHVSAEDVAERFNTMWSGDFGIGWKVAKIAQAFPEANAVMVTAPGVILEACEQAIRTIDVEARQVYIEARFVELENSAVHKLGIDWSMLNEMGGRASFGGGIDKRNIGNAVQNYSRKMSTGTDTISYDLASSTQSKTANSSWTKAADGSRTESGSTSSSSTMSGRDGGVEYFTGTLSFTDMSLVLSALDTSSDAKIFSNPKIIVASGKKATVDMTQKYPNVNIAAKRTLNGNSESLDLDMKMVQIPGEDKFMFAKEAFFSWGISLEVTPRVSSNDLINVSIVPTISEKAGEVTAGSDTVEGSKFPIISVQRLVTDFSMKAGTTAVIGGLSKTTEEQVDSGIPWLRGIPGIGDKLFGRKTRQKTQKEILVFVTVGLADPKALKTDVGLPKNAVLGRMYTQGQKAEPGDRTGNAFEGIASLDTRSLDEQARDPLATNAVDKTTFHLPFGNYEKKKEEK